MPAPEPFELRLVRARSLAPTVRELVLERADGAPFSFEAGQWIQLVLPLADGEIRRAYSIASPPDGSARVELAVTRVDTGAGSRFLHALGEGALLTALGPQGFFTRVRGQPSLFVGTGTGIAPLRSMLRDALARGDGAPLWVLFGVRHEDDLLYREELEELARGRANVRFFPTLSRGGPAWTGRRGYVQTHVRELWSALGAAGDAAPHAYVCGLERMVGAVREELRKGLGVPRQQVHSERYD